MSVFFFFDAVHPRPAYAQGTPERPLEKIDRETLPAVVDDLVRRKMTECHAPGAAISVVLDGQVVLAKGFGYANVEKQVPVTPDRTRFCIASVTKSVTATAVMQLVERRTLDLEADVNRYLTTFSVPATFPEPITLRHLLTHSSGLEDSYLGAAIRAPLGPYLAARASRLARPAELWSYANYNYSLAGYVVERASGIPYARYVEENVLRPLGMLHSGFGASSTGGAELAIAYDDEGGRWSPTQFADVCRLGNDVPAGGLEATASDMALFALAHLEGGGRGDARILEEATVRQMHARQYAFDPGLPGMAYGFMESVHRGRTALFHEGNMGGFVALLYLVPELRLGLFVASNGPGECELTSVPEALLDHYDSTPRTPSPPPPPRGSSDRTARARRLEGVYRNSRHTHSTVEKVAVVLGMTREVKVELGADGTLTVGRGRYVEIGPRLFERLDKEGRVAFHEGPDGRADQLSRGMVETYVRVPWHGRLALHRALAGACVVTFLVTALGAVVRRLRGQRASADRMTRLARRTARLLAVVSLVFLGGLVLPFFGPRGPFWLAFEIPVWFRALMALPAVIAVVAAATVGFAALAWRRNWWSLGERVRYSMIALAGLGFVWFSIYWNLNVLFV